MFLLALLNNVDPVHPVRLGPDAYRERPRVDPQRDDADLGRRRRARLHQRRAHDPAQDRRRAARLRRRRDDDRPGPARATIGTDVLAQLACVTASLCYALGGGLGAAVPAQGMSPMSVTTGQLTAGALDDASGRTDLRPAVDAGLPAADGAIGAILVLAAALHRLRLRPLFPADRFVPARPTLCW